VPVEEGTVLWTPSAETVRAANVTRYQEWLARTRGLSFASYHDLWRWSTEHLEDFWASVWEYFDVIAHHPYRRVLDARRMPGAKWFEGATLNYAEHIFRNARPDAPAILFRSERRPLAAWSWAELRRRVAGLARELRRLGVGRGDRVVAYVPNIPEAVVGVLATASLGAIWSSCSPDFGSVSVIDRFRQIEPKVLLAVDGYAYNGRDFDRTAVVAQIQAALPTLEHTIWIPYLNPEAPPPSDRPTTRWGDIAPDDGTLSFEAVPFDHPLWVLYSSGTTGLPKPIVHGHGGIVLAHLVHGHIGMDLKSGDRFFWFTTTGWMMWNVVVSGLLTGSTIILYDGSPGWPDLDVLWRLAQETGMTFFGTSAAYLTTCMKAGLEPGRRFDLGALRAVGSTGSPLPAEAYAWVYEHVKRDLWLNSASGGTDVCAGFVGGVPTLPVTAGEIQARALGAAVAAYDEAGRPVVNQVGELVVTAPMPSMPLFFWGDTDGRRYRESYFEMYPGVWRHGDWIRITDRGTCVITGRSDSTINRYGVRMGTSEIYRVVEAIPEVADSLVVDLTALGRPSVMYLFVVLKEGVTLDEGLKTTIAARIREALSPRHVPDAIYPVAAVPRTLNGKKLEVPIKKILSGVPLAQAVNPDALANPEALKDFEALAARLAAEQRATAGGTG
jgi:acetoacetyl-CoA synthetase